MPPKIALSYIETRDWSYSKILSRIVRFIANPLELGSSQFEGSVNPDVRSCRLGEIENKPIDLTCEFEQYNRVDATQWASRSCWPPHVI